MHDDVIRVVVWAGSGDLRLRLRRLPGVRIVGGAWTLHGAWRATTGKQPDAVIVATGSAGADASALARRVTHERRPLFIVISARIADACTAFEIGALDCFAPDLLDVRFPEALRRVRDRKAQDRLAERVLQLGKDLMAEASQPTEDDRSMEVSERGQRINIRMANVELVEACRNYLRIATSEKAYVVRGTLTRCAAMLRGCGFVRVHRRFLVNVHRIAGLGPAGDVWLQSGRVVPSGRVFRVAVAARLRASATPASVLSEQMLRAESH